MRVCLPDQCNLSPRETPGSGTGRMPVSALTNTSARSDPREPMHNPTHGLGGGAADTTLKSLLFWVIGGGVWWWMGGFVAGCDDELRLTKRPRGSRDKGSLRTGDGLDISGPSHFDGSILGDPSGTRCWSAHFRNSSFFIEAGGVPSSSPPPPCPLSIAQREGGCRWENPQEPSKGHANTLGEGVRGCLGPGVNGGVSATNRAKHHGGRKCRAADSPQAKCWAPARAGLARATGESLGSTARDPEDQRADQLWHVWGG